jgi:hypothetical protein
MLSFSFCCFTGMEAVFLCLDTFWRAETSGRQCKEIDSRCDHCQILNEFQKRNYCLQINPPGQAPLFYAADSEAERQQWFEVLMHTLQNLDKQPNGGGGGDGNNMPSPVDSSIRAVYGRA